MDTYSKKYQNLYFASAKAEWKSNTEIIEGDTVNGAATQAANEAFAAFTGSRDNIEKSQTFLSHSNELSEIEIKQLKSILYSAANNPETVTDLVKERIKAETEQTEKLYGFSYKIDTQEVSTNEIDEILGNEIDLTKRLAAWETSKNVNKSC